MLEAQLDLRALTRDINAAGKSGDWEAATWVMR